VIDCTFFNVSHPQISVTLEIELFLVRYHNAMQYQPRFAWDDNVAFFVAVPLFIVGIVLVLSSFYR
jgi:cytochrome c-type biogenesis protein CcmH/NrfF